MADRKISDLTALTAPAAGDYLPIVDISEASAANKNKRITIEELLRGAPDGTAGAPSIGFESDPNTGIYSPGADALGLVTGGTERLRITSAGLVGIGTTSPSGKLTVKTSTSNGSPTAWNDGQFVVSTGDTSTSLGIALSVNSADNTGSLTCLTPGSAWRALNYRASEHIFYREDAATNESARIDSSGRLLVGTSTSRVVEDWIGNGPQGLIQIEATNSDAIMSIISAGTADAQRCGTLSLGRHRNATVGATPTIVQSGDALGAICFAGGDGTDMRTKGASIRCEVDGTPGANDMPGRLVFSTTADGASSPTERFRLTSTGDLLFGTTSTAPNNSSTETGIVLNSSFAGNGFLGISRGAEGGLAVNRTIDDGVLVYLQQAGTVEGTISVSGTTVSYNGAHLSRWSQLPSGAERAEILRGSVLSNIDEMCEWGEEDNEQLNRMKVSDIEGDKNVSGVFQAWDDDDDTYTNDFYCAMTGDFIIRIAQGVTVERGDLLVSAGDGTAKPQDDDIIRSKTIAKVTSTNVSCTYEDGSYCVPCVLMAC